MSNQEEQIKALQKFICDPEWHIMEGFIEENIKPAQDLMSINPENLGDAQLIVGELMSRQRLTQMFNQLKTQFDAIKNVKDGKKKRTLK